MAGHAAEGVMLHRDDVVVYLEQPTLGEYLFGGNKKANEERERDPNGSLHFRTTDGVGRNANHHSTVTDLARLRG